MNEIEVLDRIETLPLSRRFGGSSNWEMLYGKDWMTNETFNLDIATIKRIDAIAHEKIKKWHEANPGEGAFSYWHSYKRYVIYVDGQSYVFTDKTIMTNSFRAFASKNFGIHDFSYIEKKLLHIASIVELVNKETRFSYIEKNRFGMSGIYSRLPINDRILDMMCETIARYERQSRASAEPIVKENNYVPVSIHKEGCYHHIHVPNIKIFTVEELLKENYGRNDR